MTTYPLVSTPLEALTADERTVLNNLDAALTTAHAMHAPWRVRAALIAGAALMLDAIGGAE